MASSNGSGVFAHFEEHFRNNERLLLGTCECKPAVEVYAVVELLPSNKAFICANDIQHKWGEIELAAPLKNIQSQSKTTIRGLTASFNSWRAFKNDVPAEGEHGEHGFDVRDLVPLVVNEEEGTTPGGGARHRRGRGKGKMAEIGRDEEDRATAGGKQEKGKSRETANLGKAVEDGLKLDRSMKRLRINNEGASLSHTAAAEKEKQAVERTGVGAKAGNKRCRSDSSSGGSDQPQKELEQLNGRFRKIARRAGGARVKAKPDLSSNHGQHHNGGDGAAERAGGATSEPVGTGDHQVGEKGARGSWEDGEGREKGESISGGDVGEGGNPCEDGSEGDEAENSGSDDGDDNDDNDDGEDQPALVVALPKDGEPDPSQSGSANLGVHALMQLVRWVIENDVGVLNAFLILDALLHEDTSTILLLLLPLVRRFKCLRWLEHLERRSTTLALLQLAIRRFVGPLNLTSAFQRIDSRQPIAALDPETAAARERLRQAIEARKHPKVRAEVEC